MRDNFVYAQSDVASAIRLARTFTGIVVCRFSDRVPYADNLMIGVAAHSEDEQELRDYATLLTQSRDAAEVVDSLLARESSLKRQKGIVSYS